MLYQKFNVFEKIKLLTYLFLAIGIFCCSNMSAAISSGKVVINEIMVGMPGEAKYEYIELFNNTSQAVDLTGFSLKKKTKSGSESNLVSQVRFTGVIPANGYFLITPPEYFSALGADLSYSGSSYSVSNHNTIILYDADDTVVDKVGFGEATDFENSPAVLPASGESISRQPDGKDTDSNASDFVVLVQPTPQASGVADNEEPTTSECGDGIIDEGENCDDGNMESGDGCSRLCLAEVDSGQGEPDTSTSSDGLPREPTPPKAEEKKYCKLGDVVVNEFVSDPTDGGEEWVELYSRLIGEINIDNWVIVEGSGSRTLLTGRISSAGNNYFLVKKPKGNLNNKGDIIELFDNNGALIDQVAYGDWDDGNTENNAPSAADPGSVARKIDGNNSFNNVNDFIITQTPTPGRGNVITGSQNLLDSEISAGDLANYDYSKTIIISEVLPDPYGSDNESEFIELYNQSDRVVDLAGWRLGDLSQRRFVLDKKIGPYGYLVIYRPESKIALNNGSESVQIFQPLRDDPLHIVTYGKAREGESLNCFFGESVKAGDRCGWSETVTPGKENQVKELNHPPVVDFDCPEVVNVATPIIFDSSDTVDEDGDELLFFWDFGDQATNTLPSPEHTYFVLGAFTVRLEVSDGENKVAREKGIKIAPNSIAAADLSISSPGQNRTISLSEFMPDPEGTDTENEWIELVNDGTTQINLLNWRLDDIEGGSQPYVFTQDFWVDTGQYVVIDRPETRLALNNSFDVLRLFDSQGEVVEEVEYEKTYENEAYARGQNGKWFWTTVATPGKENIISIADGLEISNMDNLVEANEKLPVKKLDEAMVTTLENIRNYDVGDNVRVRGVVAVLPGVLGSQYFYIVGSPGIQVYSYKKDFPPLTVGDYIEVVGEISSIYGEPRLKTKSREDIALVQHLEPPLATEEQCDNINEEMVGRLLSVTGEIVEKKGASLYIDDNTDEILVYIKETCGISVGNIDEGDQVTVTGILSRTNRGVRLMPRFPEDIIRRDVETEDIGQVLGEVAASDEWQLAGRDKKLELFQYLLVLAGGIIVLQLGLLIKLRKQSS